MVESFGDGRGPEQGEQAAAAFGLPQIAVMLVPVVDQEALEDAVTIVREAIADAVRAGFADALSDMVIVEDPTPPAPTEVTFDANPTLDGRDPRAYEKYAARLDELAPGWWRSDVAMAADLYRQARIRLAREEAAGQKT